MEADSDADSDNEAGCSNALKKNDTSKSMDDEFNFANYDEEGTFGFFTFTSNLISDLFIIFFSF